VVNVVVIFVLFFVVAVAYILDSCVYCKSFHICRTGNILHFRLACSFSFVISFYSVVSFDEVVETVTQKWCKVQQRTSCSVGSEHNVVLVIQFFLHEPSTVFFASVFHSGE